MGRCTYVWRGGELVDKRLAGPLDASRAAPMVRPDGMEPVRSMADGRIYDSRSRYYASVRAHGCEIVGDDRAPFERRSEFRPEGVGRDIQHAILELRSR
jgi:hypothetical protein